MTASRGCRWCWDSEREGRRDDAEAVRAHSDTHLLDNAASTASGLTKYECDFNGLKVERFNAYECIFIAGWYSTAILPTSCYQRHLPFCRGGAKKGEKRLTLLGFMTCAGLMPRGYVTVHETANRGVISLMHSLCFATENAIKLQSHVDFHGLNTKKGGKIVTSPPSWELRERSNDQVK